MASAGLDYPVVLKPDAGQRGSGVAIVHHGKQLADYLEQVRIDVLIQDLQDAVDFLDRHPPSSVQTQEESGNFSH